MPPRAFSKGFATTALAIALIAAPTAHAASTRAEYIAQVDPICQSFGPSLHKAQKAYSKEYKEWERRLSKGTLKGWERQTHRTSQALRAFVQIDAGLTDQIAAVPPPAADAGTANAWLTGRNNGERWAFAAAKAFDRFKFNRFDKQLVRANKEYAAGLRAISGFGFQVCGVSV